jgi:hypothetical protein
MPEKSLVMVDFRKFFTHQLTTESMSTELSISMTSLNHFLPELSAFEKSTPLQLESSKVKKKVKELLTSTPEKSKKVCEWLQSLTNEELTSSLLPSEKDDLDEGIGRLSDISDTPKKRKRSEVTTRILDCVMGVVAPKTAKKPTPSSEPEFHRTVAPALRESPWLGNAINEIDTVLQGCQYPIVTSVRFPQKVFDWDHIVSPVTKKGKKIGFHFCPKGSSMFSSLQEVVEHPVTGVYCAKFSSNEKGAQKYSSFFPSWIPNEKALLQLLQKGKEVARCNNRSLCYVDTPSDEGAGSGFYFEEYLCERSSRQIVNSSFPIFSLDDLSAEYTGSLGGLFKVSKEALLENATTMVRALIRSSIDLRKMPANPGLQEEWLLRQPCKIHDGENPIRFVLPGDKTTPALLIFDFGPTLSKGTGVKKGLYVGIPSTSLTVTGLATIVRAMKPRT